MRPEGWLSKAVIRHYPKIAIGLGILCSADAIEFIYRLNPHPKIPDGLVFSEALRIPNVWIKLSDKVIGDGFKFRDWFSLARAPQPQPATAETPYSDIIRMATLHDFIIDRQALKDAFPQSCRAFHST